LRERRAVSGHALPSPCVQTPSRSVLLGAECWLSATQRRATRLHCRPRRSQETGREDLSYPVHLCFGRHSSDLPGGIRLRYWDYLLVTIDALTHKRHSPSRQARSTVAQATDETTLGTATMSAPTAIFSNASAPLASSALAH